MPDENAVAALQAARIAGLSQELGIPEATAAWIISQEAENPRALRQALGARSQNFARALQERGAIPAAGDVAGAPLGEILAQAGEVREDPLNRALRALNSRLNTQESGTFVDEGGYQRDLDSGAIVDRAIASPTERPIDASALSASELAALMPASGAAENLPYAVRALSPAEKLASFQESGASRTRAGQRNALAKEPNTGYTESARDLYPGTTIRRSLPGDRDRGPGMGGEEDRYTWFTPGGVLGAGMEPDARTATIPLVVAPASQERPGSVGRFQAPNVHLKSAGGFVPGLGDARILDINPLAQLSPAAAAALEARLGESFYARMDPEKSETGGYAGRATNAPIPDPATGAGGFDPIYDPATSRGGTMAADRPMTVAEAVSRIATRNLAPISPVMLEQLTPGSGGTAWISTGPTTDGSPAKDVYPLGMPSKKERNMEPLDRLLLQAERQGTDFVDARIGSRGRYGPGLYSDLDALVGVLAGEAFPDARARFQLQATASDIATRAPVTVQDQYKPLAIERPVGTDWSLLINSANKDDLISRYQQELLARAGLDLPREGNPLLALVDNLKGMAGVPATDVPMQAAAPAAQRATRESAVLERALQQAKLRANSSVRSQLVPSETGSGVFAPDTSAYERKRYEENARTVLAGILDGRIPMAAAQGGQASPSAPALTAIRQSLAARALRRQPTGSTGSTSSVEQPVLNLMDGPVYGYGGRGGYGLGDRDYDYGEAYGNVYAAAPENPATQNLRSYMARRGRQARNQAQSSAPEPQTVVQFVPQPIYNEFFRPSSWIDERSSADMRDSQKPLVVDDGEDPYSQRMGNRYRDRRAALRATPATVLTKPVKTQEVLLPNEDGELRPYRIANQDSIPGLQVPYSSRLYTPDPIDDVSRYMAQRAQAAASAELERRHGGLRVIGPDPVSQTPLPSQLLPRPGIQSRSSAGKPTWTLIPSSGPGVRATYVLRG
jgi:hypothetical protein